MRRVAVAWELASEIRRAVAVIDLSLSSFVDGIAVLIAALGSVGNFGVALVVKIEGH